MHDEQDPAFKSKRKRIMPILGHRAAFRRFHVASMPPGPDPPVGDLNAPACDGLSANSERIAFDTTAGSERAMICAVRESEVGSDGVC